MRQNIIITLILLILLTGCGATAEKAPINPESEDKSAEAYSDSKTKLIEIESELVPEQGLVQICVYNDDFIDQGIETQYTFIDIIKDNETKATINTHHHFSEITDIDCFDYSNDEEKDIAVIGKSDSYTTVFLCETDSDYDYTDFYPRRFCGDFIQESLGNDFSMSKLKSILSKEGVGSLAKILISDAEKVTYSDYKSAYIGFLGVIKGCGFDENSIPGDSYYIYDIDKDSTPELIVKYGDCEANFHAFIFTYTDNKVKCINDILYTAHSELYAYPSGNGILQCWAHMGGEECSLFSLNNNELTSKELYSGITMHEDSETGEVEVTFKPPRDVVPDAYFLTSFAFDNVYPIEKYEVISAYVPSQDNANYTFPDNNPNFYSEIMEKDSVVNAVSDHWFNPIYNDIHFSDFLRKIEHSPSEIKDITYVDLNSDNVYECIFYVPEKDSKDSTRIILSMQGEKIYAYYDLYYMLSGWGEAEKTSITKDGFFLEEPNEHCFQERVLYDKEKWFYYSAPY